MEKEIKLLDRKDWRIVKTIRLEKNLWRHHAWADVIYVREVTSTYDVTFERKESRQGLFFDIKKNFPEDELDKLILDAIRTKYPEAHSQNTEIFTDTCIEDVTRMYQSYKPVQGTVYLMPIIDTSKISPSATFVRFSIPIDIYMPCNDFEPIFCNEGYFLDYDINNQQSIQKMLKETYPTLHHLSEFWK